MQEGQAVWVQPRVTPRSAIGLGRRMEKEEEPQKGDWRSDSRISKRSPRLRDVLSGILDFFWIHFLG